MSLDHKRITRQKIYAVTRKAGIATAKWNASGMVRGWGDWASGVRVHEYDGKIHVAYQTGRWSKDHVERIGLSRIREALDAAGIAYTMSVDDERIVICRNPQPEPTL